MTSEARRQILRRNFHGSLATHQISGKGTIGFGLRRHYEREGGRLERLAGLTTGRARKDREAQAAYASQQARFWANVEIEP